MANPKITKIETVNFSYEIQDMGTDYNGFNLVYERAMFIKCNHRSCGSIPISG